MPDAWSNTKQYLQGEVVTHGGHAYEWGSADPSVGVEPPGGSWTQMDAAPAQSGPSLASWQGDAVNLSVGGPPTGGDGVVQIQATDGNITAFLYLDNTAYAALGGENLQLQAGAAGKIVEITSANKIGFYGATPVTKPVVPLTTPDVQDVINALIALGLIVQSD
jgi:hypothetical protein